MLESKSDIEAEGSLLDRHNAEEGFIDIKFLIDLESQNIKPSFFQKSIEMIEFLEYLFKTRPGILNQTADDIFRMVVYMKGH